MNRQALQAAAAAAFLLAAPSFAQNPAQPAGETRTGTRDELRACMNNQDELNKRRADFEAVRKQRQEEIAALNAADKELAEEQKSIREDDYRKMERFNKKVKEHNAKLADFRGRQAAYDGQRDALGKSIDEQNAKCARMTVSTEDRDAVLEERAAAGK